MPARQIVLCASEGSATQPYQAAVESLGRVFCFYPVSFVHYFDLSMPALKPETPLIFTSSHGVRAFAQKNELRTNPVYTVGNSTKETALEFGFQTVHSADGDAHDLARLLVQDLKTAQTNPYASPLAAPIYVRADDVAKDLASLVLANGLMIREVIGYENKATDRLPSDLLKSLDTGDIETMIFLSAAGAKGFADLIQQYGREKRLMRVKALCLSGAVLTSLSVLPFAVREISKTPARDAMIELIQSVHENEKE